MININIEDNGAISISSETAGERIVMSEHYARQEERNMDVKGNDEGSNTFKGDGREVGPDGDPMGDEERGEEEYIDIVFDGPPSAESGRFVEVEDQNGQNVKLGEWVEREDGYWVLRFRPAFQRDESNAKFFKSGWDAAVRESQLRYVNGQIEDFWNEQNPSKISQQDAEALFEYGIDGSTDIPVPDATPAIAVITEDPDIRPVVNSGEPELESQEFDRANNRTWDPLNSGTWTMSSEELQSRLDESYQRGTRDGARKQTSEATLEMIISEVEQELSYVGIPRTLVVALAARLGFEVTQ